jgi:Flp pilus assembly protein TadD
MNRLRLAIWQKGQGNQTLRKKVKSMKIIRLYKIYTLGLLYSLTVLFAACATHRIEEPSDLFVQTGQVSTISEDATVTINFSDLRDVQIGETLYVVLYLKTVKHPQSEQVVAVEVERIADIQVAKTTGDTGAQGRIQFEEMPPLAGDSVIRYSDNTPTKKTWFEDPPSNFRQELLSQKPLREGRNLFYAGQYKEAVEKLQQSLEYIPRSSEASKSHDGTVQNDSGNSLMRYEILFLLGICYQRLGQLNDSTSALEEAKKINPQDTKLWLALAETYSRLDKKLEVIQCYRKIAELEETYEAWIELGDVCRDFGDMEEARKAYEHAHTIDPNGVEAEYEIMNSTH